MKNKFERYELKYILSLEQYGVILEEIKKHLQIDKYGESTIQSLYYDTDNYLLIRNSIEKPLYKEKLRARSYGLASDIVFLELKKKYNGIVYKRRVELKENEISRIINEKKYSNQVEHEIAYFSDFYISLEPRMLLIYDRSAFYNENLDLRITLDKNIKYRIKDLNLHTSLQGELLLDDNQVLMEIKSLKGYPLWLVKLLNSKSIYKQSFSKYGYAYQKEMKKRENQNV